MRASAGKADLTGFFRGPIDLYKANFLVGVGSRVWIIKRARACARVLIDVKKRSNVAIYSGEFDLCTRHKNDGARI